MRSRIELRSLPCEIRDWSEYSLVVPWIPDTLLYRSAQVRQQALTLTESCDTHGVPVINRPERLLSTSKHDCSRQIAGLGVRTPHVERIVDIEGFQRDLNGLKPPLLVREDLAHGGWSPVFLVQRLEDAQEIPLEKFANPIAAEFIDVRHPRDGLVRKYRYMAMGETGIAHTLQISQNWEVRSGVRLLNEQTKREEIAYADAVEPFHETLQRVRCGLGLDFLAFDYSVDQEGELVVWEINVLPGLGIPVRAKSRALDSAHRTGDGSDDQVVFGAGGTGRARTSRRIAYCASTRITRGADRRRRANNRHHPRRERSTGGGLGMSLRRARMRVKAAFLHGPYAAIDSVRNRQCRGVNRRFLILRHSAKNPHFHDYLLDWLEAKLPSVRAMFEQRLLPLPRRRLVALFGLCSLAARSSGGLATARIMEAFA